METRLLAILGAFVAWMNARLSEVYIRINSVQASIGGLFNGTPSPVGTAAPGISNLAARGDHVHAHGDQLGGTLHADVIAAGAAGFMTGADKTKLDSVTVANMPTSGEKSALAGTSGAPGALNPYVTNADPRNTNARTPSAHATSHISGGDILPLAVAGSPGVRGLLSGVDAAILADPSNLFLRIDFDLAQEANFGTSIRFEANADPSFVPRDYVVGPLTPAVAQGYYGDNIFLNAGNGGTGNVGDPGGNGGSVGGNAGDGGAGTATAVGGDGGDATLFAGDGGATGGAGAGAPGDALIGAGAQGAVKGRIGIGNLSFSSASGNADEIWLGNTTDNTDVIIPPARIVLGDSASADPSIRVVTGTPEGAVTAPVGSIALRTDGGANTTLYVKESGAGNTGWVAK